MLKISKLKEENFPRLLKEISDPPKELFCAGEMPDENNKFLCVVGSRKYSPYGKDVCEKLIEGLRGHPVVIVSGLALGIDGMAHKAALKNNLKTIAVPGSGLNENVLYPQSHVALAKEIVSKGGALISEFEPEFKATPWSFPQRNRIMAGISNAVLVIEAEMKSGTLITARLSMEYNRDVFTVPGSVFSKTSEGPHYLIRNGATPITKSADILEQFGLKESCASENFYIPEDCSPEERKFLELLTEPMDKENLIEKMNISAQEFNMVASLLEIKGLVRESLGKIRRS